VTELSLLDETDRPWVAALLDLVEHSLGVPWRVLLERVELAALAPASRTNLVLAALRRLTGGGAARGRVARRVRALVLGHPALDAAARATRLEAASAALGIAAEDLETLLWADIARERPVTLPGGRPAELAVMALANLERIERCVRRAHGVRIWLREQEASHGLVRAASRHGVIAKVLREDAGGLTLELAGPLSLFHATTVYGRALAALVGLLADHADFELVIAGDPADREPDKSRARSSASRELRVTPPVILPPVRVRGRRAPSPAERLAHDLEARGWSVLRAPEPIASGQTLLFPDLAALPPGAREPVLVELIGFSTADYLAHRLASYHAAGAGRVVLCVDERRGSVAIAPGVLPFTRRVDPDQLAAASRR
jgi:uncharacterized protein